jgi:hypothetical protein
MNIRRLRWWIGGLLLAPRFNVLLGGIVQKHGYGLPFVIAGVLPPKSFALENSQA